MIKLPASKSRIDKAGAFLAKPADDFDQAYLDEYVELESVFDKFRELHLRPLTELTSALKVALDSEGEGYYIAQRLKRKPQIIRKLNRFSTRLTQLQDIGGLRIIVNKNDDVDRVAKIIDGLLETENTFRLLRSPDYRPYGRDDSGYRALHKIVRLGPVDLEIQIRSQAQHFWAESIERTSVFYGRRLKEGEGNPLVLQYFKALSDYFSMVERGVKRPPSAIRDLEGQREQAEAVIQSDGLSHLTQGSVNTDVIYAMLAKQRANPGRFNNWILVFDWSTASFVNWEIASFDADEAVSQYIRNEKIYPEEKNYEVVLIGSSDVETVQKTHSHYFGLDRPDKILEDLGESIRKFSHNIDLDYGARRILEVLAQRKTWGMGKGIQSPTLQNHFCKDVPRFDESLKLLIDLDFVVSKGGAGVTLNVAKTAEIQSLL